jgi:hypothetical protein
MFKYFQENNEHFMSVYHKRSQCETLYSALKRTVGFNLRTKKETAQDVEILTKCLTHNILVLIRESFELGVEVDFAECFENGNFCAITNSAQIIRR